jgi:hypothetical protein
MDALTLYANFVDGFEIGNELKFSKFSLLNIPTELTTTYYKFTLEENNGVQKLKFDNLYGEYAASTSITFHFRVSNFSTPIEKLFDIFYTINVDAGVAT